MDDLAGWRAVTPPLPSAVFWRGKRVFLTGHTGFKGGWLALWLHELGAEVAGYALPPPTTPNLFTVGRVEQVLKHIEGDIRDLPGLSRAVENFAPEILFHLAAQPLVRASYKAPVETFAINLMGTVNVLAAVSRLAAPCVTMLVTSDKVYEENSGRHVESGRLGGGDPYSASKACAELAAASFPLPNRHRAATLRSGNVIGGGDWAQDRLVADFMRAMMAGEFLRLRQPGAVRPWQHVLDPLCGYLLAAEFFCRDLTARTAWNFGPAVTSEVTVAEIAERLCRFWGDSAAFSIEPEPVPLHEATVLRLDSAKAREELGWRPRFELDEALLRTVEWFRAFGKGNDMRQESVAQIAVYAAVAAA